MSSLLRNVLLFTYTFGLMASCPDKVCVSEDTFAQDFDGTYEKQSEDVYHQEFGKYALYKCEGHWLLGDKNHVGDCISYVHASSSSKCPNGASYAVSDGGSTSDMQVADKECTGSSLGLVGTIVGLLLTCLVVAGVVWCCCKHRQGTGGASQGATTSIPAAAVVVAVPQTKQVNCPHCGIVIQLALGGEQAFQCGSCAKTFTVPPTLLGARGEEAKVVSIGV